MLVQLNSLGSHREIEKRDEIVFFTELGYILLDTFAYTFLKSIFLSKVLVAK